MTRKQRKMLLRILLSAALFLCALVADALFLGRLTDRVWPSLLCYALPYLLIGYDVLFKALRNLLRLQLLDECFLMTVATLGAILIGFIPGGEAEYAEAVGVMLFYQVGELFQSIAVGKSRKSIAALMDIRPDTATILAENGEETVVDPAEVTLGSTILIRPGERIPLDGCILSGVSTVDTAALTGESLPREVREGDAVISGTVNLTGPLRVRTTRTAADSTVSRILSLVEDSGAHKARSERFITRFAQVYTPIVVISALLLAVIPSLIDGQVALWVSRALTFLVVSCPCALVISVPLSFFGGIGGASRSGILVKGANYLETLARAEVVVFDKTGTLTEGRFSVVRVLPSPEIGEVDLLSLAAHAELHSAHPIAAALRASAGEIDPARISAQEAILGRGARAVVDGAEIYVGNAQLMADCGIDVQRGADDAAAETVVFVARGREYLGAIYLADRLKGDAASAITELRLLGVRRTVMLTGDREEVAAALARSAQVDGYRASLLPDGKVRELETLLNENGRRGAVVFVGDGVNDAPVLARADVGVAMGALGTDAAIEAADVVLMDDSLSGLARALRIARRTVRIARQNVIFAVSVKVAVMLLAAIGYATMWLAVFADVGVAVLAILNAMRTMRLIQVKNQTK